MTVAFSSTKTWPGKEQCGMGSCATICEMLTTTISMPDFMLSNLVMLTCIGKAAYSIELATRVPRFLLISCVAEERHSASQGLYFLTSKIRGLEKNI